ncbi:MAG: hypothetical protein R3Y60_00470 [bacterium]
MKKILAVASLIGVLTISGCSKVVTQEAFIEGLVEYNTNLSSYYSNVTLEIIKQEDVINFEVEVYYLAEDYYKVIMKDLQTNNTQAIVKNDDGVTVLTPLLNKQFKFSSDWPLNSSHAYLYQSLVKDITNDETASVIHDDTNFVVTSAFNSKTNAALKTQKVTLTNDYKPLYCVVLNEAQETQIKATYNDFVDNYSLKTSDFDTNAVTTSLRLEMGEGVFNTVIEDVVPTYTPDNTDVSTSSTDDYVMYNYSGDYNYTITCQKVEEDAVLSPSVTYDDFVLLSSGIAAYKNNSITFYQGDVQVTIFSNTLDIEMLVSIADSF